MKKINVWSRLIVSILALCLCGVAAADSAVVANSIEATQAEYPGEQWTVVHPESLNLEQSKIDRLFDLSFQDSATEAVVLIKNGFLVGERYADGYDQSSYGTSWSMAKSFYASLIGISIDRGEIASLDDKVSQYLDYFNDERADITLRQLLNMTSGLEMPSHEHENMFFTADHLAYAKAVGVEKEAGQTFEYNNVNSMLLADILQRVTGVPADELLRDRVLNKIGLTNVTLWRDSAGNPLTYCCIDTTARDYSRFGLLFSRGGKWNDEQVISERYVNETFTKVWGNLSGSTIEQERGYSLHWWISRHDEKAIIFNASGKFGQYIFVDRANDVIFTRITKYHSTGGSVQNWGPLAYINWIGSVNFRSKLAAILDSLGLMTIQGNVQTPLTFEDGTSKEFNTNYNEIMDALVDISAKN